jgi:pyruvate ferredoxin oxidoreductase gamma subunit
MAVEILARAFLKEGKHAMSMPSFGPERRGAPVTAFVRVDDSPIRHRTQVYHPDCLIVVNPGLKTLPAVYQGLKQDCILVLNAVEPPEVRLHQSITLVGSVDGTGIALEEIGAAITNTCLLGAFAATTHWLSLDSILSSMEKNFTGERLQANINSARRGFNEVTIIKY